jgi:hypothetical protein
VKHFEKIKPSVEYKCGIPIVRRKNNTLSFPNFIFFHSAYDILNGSIDLIYRVDHLYGLGYLLRRSFYDKNMKNSFKECCSKR